MKMIPSIPKPLLLPVEAAAQNSHIISLTCKRPEEDKQWRVGTGHHNAGPTWFIFRDGQHPLFRPGREGYVGTLRPITMLPRQCSYRRLSSREMGPGCGQPD